MNEYDADMLADELGYSAATAMDGPCIHCGAPTAVSPWTDTDLSTCNFTECSNCTEHQPLPTEGEHR
ncbi:hypothetical protein [Enemella evansiae]|uniref:hypothetical protein n=1 Tax=Enemella evansiae TaxID=2016499 RepID=UPI000B96EA50|nr:hypothetical protein [Enemella evansiae]OYO05448.1 hypothetical protein CGZ97_01580 [Enemella evansiae]